jgi:oligopeptide/dipeptide ABC transporter ATP-binding protein
VPDPTRSKTKERQLLIGDLPSPTNPPPACRFHTRCPKVQPICTEQTPPLEPKSGGGMAACHFPLTVEEVRRSVPTAAAETPAA